jgi:hypothetical protein
MLVGQAVQSLNAWHDASHARKNDLKQEDLQQITIAALFYIFVV